MLLSIDLSISVNIVLLSLVPPLYQHFFYFFAQSQVTLNGAGATFPFPLIDTWRVVYQKVHPNVNINYQSIGSGGGVKQFTAKTVDFGASDAPLTPEERQAALGAVQIPEAIGSVAVAYNIPGIPTKTLKFTGPVLADIFQGTHTDTSTKSGSKSTCSSHCSCSQIRWIGNNVCLDKLSFRCKSVMESDRWGIKVSSMDKSQCFSSDVSRLNNFVYFA